MSNDKGYNGWTNYETWCVNLWLDNDEGMSGEIAEWAREEVEEVESTIEADEDEPRPSATYNLGERIKDYIEECQPEVTGMFADLLTSALQAVNWREIAEHYIDSIEE